MIYGTGARVVVSPAYGASLAAGPVRYLEIDAVHSVEGSAYEKGIDSFLTKVVETCVEARDGEALRALVDQLRKERLDSEVAAWRKLEAQLGFDPDQAPASLMKRLAALEEAVGERALEEAAVSAPGLQAGRVLEDAIAAAKLSNAEVDFSLARAVDPSIFDASIPWRIGEEAARWARHAVGVTEGPVGGGALSMLSGRSWTDLEAAEPTARNMPYATRFNDADRDTRLSFASQQGIDRRFELARMIADEMWAPGDTLGVVSRARTERQRFQRAFAHGFLLPFHELPEIIDFEDPTDEQIDEAAGLYEVRPSVVRGALTVKGVLPRESFWDRQEAA
jgi:hypothetical protein